MEKYENKAGGNSAFGILLTIVLSMASLCAMVMGLRWGLLHVGVPGSTTQTEAHSLAMMDRYDMYMTNVISNALDGVLDIEKIYWLSDEDMIAPEPDQSKFGKTKDPATMQAFLDDAAKLLDGQSTLFTTEIPIKSGTEIIYYLDETIMCITWKQVINYTVYTISEVKIADASQFRRFLADGKYGSDKKYTTTEMASAVNAVTASSGDFYQYRPFGITVYNGEVYKADSRVDTCFITDTGEMLFSRAGEFAGEEEIEAFVEKNNVRFSLSFGPILVENYEACSPNDYLLGRVDERYARAGLGYLGELHYLLVASNPEGIYKTNELMSEFAESLQSFGCEKAYALDGGQTAVISTNGELINTPAFGYQRMISDIIYFATAIPDGGGE